MRNDVINNEYFEWLYNLVCEKKYARQISYRKLLMFLHITEFVSIIPRDENRADDGVSLRYRFSVERGYENQCLNGSCSVLEMMVALSIRCEEGIMDDPKFGNRTSQWFWGMINNLGMGAMNDDRFDRRSVKNVIDTFIDRRYEPNGKGGLFTIKNSKYDLREVEIWYQMCWYLDNLV